MKKPYFSRIIILVACISFTVLPTDDAVANNTQIQTDNTLSGITAFSVDSAGAGQVYTLSEINGKTAGKNLFYSFSNFNIDATDTAWFDLGTPGLKNVISRVTGGFESSIEGTLKMTNAGGVPAFFFINSAGITFGSGASVDVPGAFYVSTASTLNLDDGSEYVTNGTGASILSTANPESFGFLGDESGKLNIGSLDTAETILKFKPGTDVGFVANQIQIDNATVENADILKAGINLQIVATGDEAIQIMLSQPSALTLTSATAGSLVIKDSFIETSGDGGGHLTLRAGNFIADNDSELYADNMGDLQITDGGGIDIAIRSQLLIDNRSLLASNAYGKGHAGDINIVADIVNLKNDALLDSSTFDVGNAGDVSIEARQIIIDGATIQVDADNQGAFVNDGKEGDGSAGSAGSVVIIAELLQMNNGSIFSESFASNLSENFQAIDLSVAKLELKNDSIISSSTFGAADAGIVFIQAEQIELNASEISSSAKINSTGGAGIVAISGLGDTIIPAESLRIINGGKISSSTASETTGVLPGVVNIYVKSLEVIKGGEITTSSSGQSDAGEVSINAKYIDIRESAIVSKSKTGAVGLAGIIDIDAENIQLDNSTVSIENNASFSVINSSTDAAINIDTGNLVLKNSHITANASGGADAGDITIIIKGLLFLDPSTISTKAIDGNGGDITIEGGNIVYLLDSSITTSVESSPSVKDQFGDGGFINITANNLILNSGFIQANTEADGGFGGDIDITNVTTLIPSGNFLQRGGNTPFIFQPFSGINVIQAAAPTGISGSINTAAPQLNLSGMLTNLAIESFDSNALNRNMCAVDEGSSLFQSGKGGMHMRARDFLLSPGY